jgi:phenylalanyl-tRNA synthetase beta chain
VKVPLRWLQEFIDLPTDDPAELKTTLDNLGHQVEGYELLGAHWSDVVVGRVEEIEPHPDADKIRVCQVDTGTGPEQIICGAWNFSEGAHVAVAKPGAVLPGDFKIGQRKIRGVVSNGMICSEKELGLGADHTGIIILEGRPELGIEFADLVELPDVVFDLSITPNRPDAMSLLGIARDLAAYYETPHRVPDLPLSPVPGTTTDIDVVVEDPAGCPRFTAREIRGVTMGASPLRIRHRLSKVGVRAISNVVDVTNYVMFELGHPLHAFDADSIIGRKLRVRRASDGESLVTLDGVTRNLSSADLIIYDENGPTSMSGTMGGARSEVSDDTVNVLMEAASWHPPTIMYMSRRHGLRSEASTRFERGVDPDLADLANRRASAMVASLAGGGVLEGSIDVTTSIKPASFQLELSEVGRILGSGFDRKKVGGILERLGMDVSGDDPMTVVVPTYRPDVTRPIDLIEEVARIHGFDKFGATVPTGPAGFLTAEQHRLRQLRGALTGIGLSQTVTLPFIGEEDLLRLGQAVEADKVLTVKNPLREEEGRLRPAMLPSLLNVAKYNFAHGARSVAIFETGLVFSTDPYEVDPRLPAQIDRLAWLVAGPVGIAAMGQTQLDSDGWLSLGVLRHALRALDIEEALIVNGTTPGYHPGRTAEVSIGGEIIGFVGELSPSAARAFELPGRIAVAELDLDPLVKPVPFKTSVTPSAFPHVDFDLSFEIDLEMPLSQLISVTSSPPGSLVESARVFDEFKDESLGEGRRAVAIRYRLRAPDRTLSNEELGPLRDAMIEAAGRLGARLRGA